MSPRVCSQASAHTAYDQLLSILCPDLHKKCRVSPRFFISGQKEPECLVLVWRFYVCHHLRQ
jgi:hypothetical protein